MLEKISKVWPLVTVAAFAIVSIFNVGYFVMPGLHFIGVMDVSNIVYPTGLILSLLLPALAFIPS
jgi:hypothetical protein